VKGHAKSAHANLPPAPAAGQVKTSGAVRVRVRYCECDPMNVAHHAAYIPWLEIGRTEILRESGVSYAALEHAGVFLVVVKLELKYRRPVLYDDLVEVRTRWTGGSKVKIEHEYEVAVVERAGTAVEVVAAVASTTLACVGKEGQVQVLPPWLAPAGG
jgi:acyl-CoA thioester hydrolase